MCFFVEKEQQLRKRHHWGPYPDRLRNRFSRKRENLGNATKPFVFPLVDNNVNKERETFH